VKVDSRFQIGLSLCFAIPVQFWSTLGRLIYKMAAYPKGLHFVGQPKWPRTSSKSKEEWDHFKPQIMEICQKNNWNRSVKALQSLGFDVR
jgi:hypothetical protein